MNQHAYRADIDGLRAIAVGSVVLYHAGLGCPGGYIGVDVFFVISGYLITSLIFKDLERGTFSFVNFWERRARRIAPALFVVSIATLIAGWMLLLPFDLELLGKATTAQALCAANIYYWRNSGYFAPEADELPLLHTWSLAVEEQFYLVVPILLWALYRLKFQRSQFSLKFILGAGILLSLTLSVVAVVRKPEAAFFLLPTRTWELLLGSFVAALPTNSTLLRRQGIRELVAFTGLISIVAPAIYYTKETPFPGLAAVPPCLGTALLIWANGTDDALVPTWAARLLSLKPLVFVGLISYSLYLWHWPLLAFATYTSPKGLALEHRWLAVGLGCLLAVVSWKFVETPFRQKKLMASPRTMIGSAALGLAAFVALGMTCVKGQGFPNRFNARSISFANAYHDRTTFRDVSINDVQNGELTPIGDTTVARTPTILVWGDSHARSALPAFDELLKERGISGRGAIRTATAPVVGWYNEKKVRPGKSSLAYNESVLEFVQKNPISDVFLVARWSYYRNSSKQFDPAFTQSLVKTVERVVAAGAQPWILYDVPNHPFNVPRAGAFYSDAPSLSAIPSTSTEHDGFDQELIARLQTAGVRFLNPKPFFLDPISQRYAIELNGTVLYYDKDHLTVKGAMQVLLPFLRDAIGCDDL